MIQKVRSVAGVPLAAAFQGDDGTPILIDQATGIGYVKTTGGVVVPWSIAVEKVIPAFSAWIITTIAPGNVVPFNQVTFNEEGGYDSATGKFTAPVAGKYQFNWTGFPTSSSGSAPPVSTNHIGYFRKNGTKIQGTDWRWQNNNVSVIFISVATAALVELAIGDYVECYLQFGYFDYGSFSGFRVK